LTGPPGNFEQQGSEQHERDSLEQAADPDSAMDSSLGSTPQGAPVHPIVGFSDADLAALLDRVVRITVILGVVVSLVLWPVLGWGSAALFAVGAAISVFSVYEWKRLVAVFNASMDRKQTPRGSAVVVVFFLLRLILFGAAIYVSLKCFQGSPIALICGLALAVAGLVWESLKLLRS
jgi:hypothetical protein